MVSSLVSSQNTGSNVTSITQDEFGLMVSVPQSPWLGANAKPPEEHGVPKGKPQTLGGFHGIPSRKPSYFFQILEMMDCPSWLDVEHYLSLLDLILYGEKYGFTWFNMVQP